MSDAELRRIAQQSAFHNILTIVQIMNGNQTLDEAQLRTECDKAVTLLQWFKTEIKETMY